MNPYHFAWQWSYTFLAAVLLLVLFALCGVVLLVRRFFSPPSQEQHHRPASSISTPSYGALGYRQVNAQVNPDEGYRRAAHTQYYPRIER